MKNQNTPGPWAYEKCTLKDGGINLIGDGKIILQNIRFTDSPKFIDGAKNAALIQAAPDLLAALEEFLLCGPNAGHNQDLILQVTDAITKAKGGAK